PADGDALTTDVSADGNEVAFLSTAANLGGGDSTHRSAYVKDLQTGALTWVSKPEDGNIQHTDASDVSISADGKRVAFTEADASFGFGSNGTPHVFLRDLAAGTTKLVSLGTPGGLAAPQSSPSLDADGGALTFTEDKHAGLAEHVFLRDLAAGTTTALESGAF